MCEGSLGGSVQKREISSTKVGLFATTRGLILRNIGLGKIVRGTKHLLGGLEESIFCYHLIEEGYYPAKQFNNPTLNKNYSGVNKEGSFIHDEKVWDKNCAGYIRDRYDDPNWDYQKKRLPRALKNKLNYYFGDKITKERIFKWNPQSN